MERLVDGMYKEYMLKCEYWNPLEGRLERIDLYFY